MPRKPEHQGGGGAVRRRKILIISYLFPPMGGIGVQRALSLAKYLPRCGYDVHVLKATNAGGPVLDPDLAAQIPAEVLVHEAFTPEIPFAIRHKIWARLARGTSTPEAARRPSSRFSAKRLITGAVKKMLCPEPEVLWVPFALRKARQIIRRHQIDCALVTVPPFSALIAATALKREFPSLVLISDFRDEWLKFYLRDFEFQNSDYTRRRAEAIERECVAHSDLVVAVNRSSRDEIRQRYPDQPERKFVVLPNGYDPEIFAAVEPRPTDSNCMVITHVGTVYKTASPRYFLDALEELPEHVRRHIEARFIGRISTGEAELLEARKATVKVLGFMPQAKALQAMHATDFLLLTMTNEISVPGKLFEYMASRKPILAIAPAGSEVERILQETRAGVCVAPDDRAGIRTMLVRAFQAWQDGVDLVQLDAELVRRYERGRLAEEYGSMIREVAESAHGAI